MKHRTPQEILKSHMNKYPFIVLASCLEELGTLKVFKKKDILGIKNGDMRLINLVNLMK